METQVSEGGEVTVEDVGVMAFLLYLLGPGAREHAMGIWYDGYVVPLKVEGTRVRFEGDLLTLQEGALAVANALFDVSEGHVGWVFSGDRAPYEVFMVDRGRAGAYWAPASNVVTTFGRRDGRLLCRAQDLDRHLKGIKECGAFYSYDRLGACLDREPERFGLKNASD